MILTDEELMIMVKNGDPAKMRELFLRYQIRIYLFINRQVQNRDVSLDLTQDVFYRALKYRSTYSSSSFSSWLYTIAKNTCKDYFKSNSLQLTSNEIYEEKRRSVEDENPNSEVLSRSNVLFKVLNLLSSEERDLIEMSKFQGLRYKEIAEIKCSSEGAIKTKIHRILKKLRHHFQSQIIIDE